MTSAQRAAHLRLLEAHPKRTHEWRPTIVTLGMKRSDEENEELAGRLRAAREAGASIQDMKVEFRVSEHTIHKLIGKKNK